MVHTKTWLVLYRKSLDMRGCTATQTFVRRKREINFVSMTISETTNMLIV